MIKIWRPHGDNLCDLQVSSRVKDQDGNGQRLARSSLPSLYQVLVECWS